MSKPFHLFHDLLKFTTFYRIMQKEYGETYFVPLMVTGMALVSRLHACAQTIQKEIPSCRTKLQI